MFYTYLIIHRRDIHDIVVLIMRKQYFRESRSCEVSFFFSKMLTYRYRILASVILIIWPLHIGSVVDIVAVGYRKNKGNKLYRYWTIGTKRFAYMAYSLVWRIR